MEERTAKVMELKNKGALEGKKVDAGMSQWPDYSLQPKGKPKKKKKAGDNKPAADDNIVRFQGDGLRNYNPTTQSNYQSQPMETAKKTQDKPLMKLFFNNDATLNNGLSMKPSSFSSTQNIMEGHQATHDFRMMP